MKENKFQVYWGGTFDPPHLGHHEILKALLQDTWVEKVFLSPTSVNPLKKIGEPESGALGTADQRKDWLEAWVQQVRLEVDAKAFEKLEVYWGELFDSGVTYTIDTLKKIKEITATSTPFVLALGSDQLPSFNRWKNLSELLGLLNGIWIFSRAGENKNLNFVRDLPQLPKLRWMATQPGLFASSEIRKVLRKGLRRDELEKELSTQVPKCLVPKLLNLG